MDAIYHRRILNTLEALTGCMDECNTFLKQHQSAGDVSFAISLGLEEMVSNIIKYGFASSGDQWIDIQVVITPENVVLEIIDEGIAFNPFDKDPPNMELPIEERPIGGLGIHIVKNLMDQCDYERKGNRNIIRLTKNTLYVPIVAKE